MTEGRWRDVDRAQVFGLPDRKSCEPKWHVYDVILVAGAAARTLGDVTPMM